MKQKNLYIILSLIAGLGLGYVASLPGSSRLVAENDKLKARLEKVKQFFPVIDDMRSIAGTIEKIDGNAIVLKTFSGGNPLEELPEVREITIGDATKIVKIMQRDPDEYQKETDAYQKEIEKLQKSVSSGLNAGANAVAFPAPPNPFEEIAIKFSDLKTGDQITVEAGKNIKTKESFEAARIVKQEALPAIPTP